MELIHLKYFQTIARLESVTQAAAELHVSQPALSKILARLERELGQSLFDRKNRCMCLNTAGKLFLQHVQRVFLELREARKELAALSDSAEASVVAASSSSRLLPNLLTSYLQADPQGSFRLKQITEIEDMRTSLLMEQIDFSISFQPLRHKDIKTQRLASEQIFLAVAPDHPLACCKRIELAAVRQEKFISLTSECGLRELTTDFCEQAGFHPDVRFEINSLEVIGNLVNAGYGVAFVPAFWRKYEKGKAPVQIPIDSPGCYRDVWISYRKNEALTAAQQKFLTFVKKYFAMQEGQVE